MPNLVNIWAEAGADIIGDDAQPTLTFRNTSTGSAILAERLAVVSTASIDAVRIGGPILAAAATITNLHLAGASRASGAIFALKGDAFTSAVSLIFAAGTGWAGMGAIRVVRTDGTFGWVPVLPDGQVTAA